MKIKENQIILSFKNIGSGLFTTNNNGSIKGFEIAGVDRVFHFAQVFIKGHTVVLSSEMVIDPIVANFGWMGIATEYNLLNKDEFPAVPFRTKEWKNATKTEKYKIEKL